MEYTLMVYHLNEKRHGFMKDCFSKWNDHGKDKKYIVKDIISIKISFMH